MIIRRFFFQFNNYGFVDLSLPPYVEQFVRLNFFLLLLLSETFDPCQRFFQIIFFFHFLRDIFHATVLFAAGSFLFTIQ